MRCVVRDGKRHTAAGDYNGAGSAAAASAASATAGVIGQIAGDAR